MAEYSYSRSDKSSLPPKIIRRRRLFLIVPAVFLIIIFLYVIGYKAGARKRELTDYIQTTNRIAAKSNSVAKELENQFNSPSLGSKASFKTKLMDMVQECQNLRDYAYNIEIMVPDELADAHGFFKLSMKLRHKGMELYKPPIFEAVSSNTPKIEDNDIAEALKYLALSDLAYENYIEELKAVIRDEKLDIKPVLSKFLSESDIYEKKNILAFINKLKGENFTSSADISVLDVATEPLRTSINTQTDVRVLPVTDSVSVRIEVKNLGKKAQKDIPVEVELLAEGQSKGQKKEGKIVEIAADGIAKITIEGFRPDKTKLNIFKIKVGPLFGEESTDDNYYEYKFILQEPAPPVSTTTDSSSGSND